MSPPLHTEGERTAGADNADEYDRGRAAGLALSRDDGEREGAADGRAVGDAAGYSDGYREGYAAGFATAVPDPAACPIGSDEGRAAGAADGDGEGFAAGHREGWDAGAAAGTEACPAGLRHQSEAADVDAKELDTCRDRGYRAKRDGSAGGRGLADGRRANPAYQAGFAAAWPGAYEAGFDAGRRRGLTDGGTEGRADGRAQASQDVYDECHAAGYAEAYQACTTGYEYDATGRLVREVEGQCAFGPPSDAGMATEHDYDDAGRLISSTTRFGSGPPDVTRYRYDAEGNLIEKTRPDGFRVTYDWACWKETRP